MFVDVTQWEVRPERWDEALALFRERVVPAFEAQPGFFRVLHIGDGLSGKGMTLAFWQSEAHARTFERTGRLAGALEPFAGLFTAPPRGAGYPVLVDREF